VSAFASAGVVDGLARIEARATHQSTALAAPPVGAASELPAIAARALRAVASAGMSGAVLTTSESITIVRPTADPPGAGEATRKDPAAAATQSDANVVSSGPRSSLAQSRRLGLGPGYHGPLPDAIRQDRIDRTGITDDEPTSHTESVPDDVRTIMRAAYGVDLGDQVVHRGSEVSDEARQLGARAFARDGEVFVPIEAGPLDEAPAKSLLAHELTHLAQQRRRTAPLPADGSPEDRLLEAEAQRAERFVRGDPGAPLPGPSNADAPSEPHAVEMEDTQRFVNELVHRGVAEPDGNGGVRFLWGHGGGGRVQRADEPAAPGTAAKQENWGLGARFANAIGETISDEFDDMIAGEFSFVPDLAKEMQTSSDEREREYKREQTREAFRQLRLEHVRTRRTTSTPGLEITEDVENEMKREVDLEITWRLAELKDRVDKELAAVNKHLQEAKQPTTDRIDPDRFDVIYNKLFADPEGPIPPADEDHAIEAEAKKSVDGAKEAALKAAKDAKGTAPGATGGTPPAGTPTGATGAVAGGGATAVVAGAATPKGTPAKTPGGAGADDEGKIDSWSDVKGMYATEFATTAAGEWGIDLTDKERKELWDPNSDGVTKPAGASPTGTPAPGGGAPTPAGAAGHHDMIDLERIDLGELTKRLYPRVREKLSQELLVDRERAGRLNH
jgi:hypothetical protein